MLLFVDVCCSLLLRFGVVFFVFVGVACWCALMSVVFYTSLLLVVDRCCVLLFVVVCCLFVAPLCTSLLHVVVCYCSLMFVGVRCCL